MYENGTGLYDLKFFYYDDSEYTAVLLKNQALSPDAKNTFSYNDFREERWSSLRALLRPGDAAFILTNFALLSESMPHGDRDTPVRYSGYESVQKRSACGISPGT
jgi:hypothetical protein